MRLWIDDLRNPPDETWRWAKSVNEVKTIISTFESLKAHNCLFGNDNEIEIIDLDHDAGEYAYDGGDYIKILDWLEERGTVYPIHLHTMNPVGRERMQAIIRHNNWPEVR